MRRLVLVLVPLLAACGAPTLGAGPIQTTRRSAWETHSPTMSAMLGVPMAQKRRNDRRAYSHHSYPGAQPQGLREWLEEEGIIEKSGPRWRVDRWGEKVILPGGTEVEIHKGDPPPEDPASEAHRWAEERLQRDLDDLPPAPTEGFD